MFCFLEIENTVQNSRKNTTLFTDRVIPKSYYLAREET